MLWYFIGSFLVFLTANFVIIICYGEVIKRAVLVLEKTNVSMWEMLFTGFYISLVPVVRLFFLIGLQLTLREYGD